MGTYLNPLPVLWQRAINSEIYVDKTGLINYTNSVINTNQAYVCVSRPRRFGKTMATNMLSAYYNCKTDARKLFKGFKIAGDGEFAFDEEAKKAKEKAEVAFEKYANKFNVIYINAIKFFGEEKTVTEGIKRLCKQLRNDFSEDFPEINLSNCDEIEDYFMKIFHNTNIQFVILIDEWDCVFRERMNDVKGQKQYLDFLRAWLKDQPYVALAYMTGILPIKKYGKHSALNMFEEFSMDHQFDLEEYTGFTNTDVKKLCAEYDVNYSLCKYWYDGYQFRNVKEVYNPLSVVRALRSKVFESYWSTTETFEALKIYIDMNFDGLKDTILKLMAGERVKIDTTTFSNDMVTFHSADDVMTLLIHLGYLGYDSEKSKVFIPNNEIRTVYAAAVKHSSDYAPVTRAIKTADELLEATLLGDNDAVAKYIETAHVETSHLQYNDENALSYTISLAYYTARNKYNIIRELPAGKGFADMVFLPLPHHPKLSPMIVELKWNKSAVTAIKQIKEKNYPESLKGYEGKVILVGINYDKKTRKHTCKIENDCL